MSLASQVFSQSSLVAISKIASAQTRLQRIIWVIISTAMFMGLCSCITLVIIQYCMHQTVFQLDYSGRHTVYDQIPGITICPDPQEIQRLFNYAREVREWPGRKQDAEHDAVPWLLPAVNKELLKMITANKELDPPGAIGQNLPPGSLYWDTQTVAKSPIYRALHNFSVTFNIKPANIASNYQLFVLEQVPNIRQFMCTTFELTTQSPELGWSHVEITIEQDMHTAAIATGTGGRTKPRGTTFAIITHERGELPFSAYDRNIYTTLAPETEVSIYYSKSVTRRVNTARSPCHDGADAAWLAQTLEITKNNTTFLDFLDRRRLEIKRKRAWPTSNVPYFPDRQSTDMRTNEQQQPATQKSAKAVSLFNTEFLYSREACGWKVCCVKVATECGCTCSMDWLLSTGAPTCPNDRCERTQCSDSPVLYDQCPMPCVISKFVKQNLLVIEPPDSRLPTNTSKLKLIRSENVQVAAEEEIYSLAKLFSEIGGLCSLFIGFSCIFFFELIEALLLIRRGRKAEEEAKLNRISDNAVTQFRCASETKELSASHPRGERSPLPAVTNHHNYQNQSLFGEDEGVTLPVILRSGVIVANHHDPVERLTVAEKKSMNHGTYLLADSQG
ncbi:unnamed protein product [Mesocestoides corti]|nr:unnamed protein product [Mesocestoides corti]